MNPIIVTAADVRAGDWLLHPRCRVTGTRVERGQATLTVANSLGARRLHVVSATSKIQVRR